MSSVAGVLVWTALSRGLEVDPTNASPVGAGVEAAFSKATYTYKRVGECDIKADVYRLPGTDVRPAVMWIHGGALIFGDRGTVRPDQLQRYLRAGYVVVSVDYRLAPETKLPAIIDDVRDAYRWVREKGPALFSVDPDRIALVGNSAGGYLALMAGSSLTPRPKAVVSFYGYGDITGEWTTRPDRHYLKLERVTKEEAYRAVGGQVLSESPLFPRVMFYNYCRQNGLWPREVAAVDPDKEPDKLEQLSPIRHVTKEFPPTLLLHGDKDTDVPFGESARMAETLRRFGVQHQLIRMHNYDHLFDVFPTGWTPDAEPLGLKDPKVAAAYDRVVAFLRKHLGP
jgi:acetyl esterase/lipase